MEEMIVLLSLAGPALVLWINYLIAREFYRTACMKGHYQIKYLWLPFFLGAIGYLIVVALPDKSALNHGVQTQSHNQGNDLPII